MPAKPPLRPLSPDATQEHDEPAKGLLDVYRSVNTLAAGMSKDGLCLTARFLQPEGFGYEVRLSWPKDNDRKRAITGISPPAVEDPSRGFDLFVNTTSQDVELYRNAPLSAKPLHPVQSGPSLSMQAPSDRSHADLIQHFQSTAYLSLATFTTTNSQMRETLMRMARARDTAAGLALHSAMLAFSSLHRDGLHQQTAQLKISALQFLSASARGGTLSSAEAARHAAALMLLGAFEIFLPSENSGEWLWYVWGAMKITQAARLKDYSDQRDVHHLLDWVHFHNTLSHFPIRHWRHRPLSTGAATAQPCSPGEEFRPPSLETYRIEMPALNVTHAVLNLLSDVCERLLDPWDPRSREADYHANLRALERRAESLSLYYGAEEDADIVYGAEIWRIATRIYLARASQNRWEPSADLDSVIDAQFVRITTFYSCRHFFPMFILSCEARTDERRAAIIGLIDRTERSARTRSLKGLRDLIQSIWVQQDLHADSDLLVNYHGIISTVVSSGTTPLSFV
ncbi:fungal-specific transcription factor domain-containing protein [Colletotrichum navitas]|uniref:Fungal-specific transcription factor domain-containing protein n=1 Tax=Colletotrichum navitas TaxID=681940 RepID=A0AAD8PNU2_9PEZI|nr:fungal-specific transcription factor domain-containing protein [Colletotrichum navitas]KAK1572978.1 fungal-specific transcription factor domain-containing protein [Colletotrichum navitas]